MSPSMNILRKVNVHAAGGIDIDRQGQNILPAIPSVAKKVAQRCLDGGGVLPVPVEANDDVAVEFFAESEPHVTDHSRAVVIHEGGGLSRLQGQARTDFPSTSEFACRSLALWVGHGSLALFPGGVFRAEGSGFRIPF